jgi:periplasmic protein TonB
LRRPSPESLSQAAALVVTVAVTLTMVMEYKKVSPHVASNHPAIEIELAPEAAPPAPRIPDPPAPTPPTPRPVRRKAPARPESAPPSAPLMAQTADAPVVNEATESATDPAPAVAAAPSAVPAGTIEAQYAATLRTNIDARTVVPNSVEYRLSRPKGETRVDFTLDRGGSVLAATIAHTSGWEMLDRQALSIVKAGHYPPFPAEAFTGQARHTFLVTLEFYL